MKTVPRENQPRQSVGERRHLTVMFCDIVDYSRLSDLDPEELKKIVDEYHKACEHVVHEFDAFVAEKPGDGLIAYFGWPVAHEDEARRAGRASLGIVKAIKALNPRLKREYGISLEVRIGVDSGTVVVEKVGDTVHATGKPPTVAARLQGIAAPDTVIASTTTFSLIRRFFDFEDLGVKNLKGMTTAARAYRVVAEREIEADNLTPLIGRQSEIDELLDAWNRAVEGRSQVAYLSGEPGIGKTRIVNVVRQSLPKSVVFRCSQNDSQSTLFPVIRHVERVLGFDQLEDVAEKLNRLEQKVRDFGFSVPDVLPLLANQFSLPLGDGDAPRNVSTQKRRQQTLGVFAEWLVKEAQEEPMMAVWEDLHWADPSTLELLGLVIERAARSETPLFTLMTFRPDEFQPPWPTLSAAEVTLARLEPSAVEEMITKITAGRSLPREVVEQIVEKTDGVPLFVEELVQTVLDSGFVREEAAHFVMAGPAFPIAIPATLEDSLMSRLDRLGAAKSIAQRGAILGRAFSQELLRAVLDLDTQTETKRAAAWRRAERCLTQLVEAGMLRRKGNSQQTTYEFKHALTQNAAYQSLLKEFRHKYHLQTAEVLETEFPHIAETQPELVAHHFAEAARHGRALDYWQKAGERARDRSANREAIHHFAEALKILEALPENEERYRRELVLRIASITPLIAVEGYVADATSRTAERALALCRALGDVERLFPVMYVLWVIGLVGAKYTDAMRLSRDFTEEANKRDDSATRLMSHRLRGFTQFTVGDPIGAQDQLERSLRLYDPRLHGELKNRGYGQDPRCACEAFMALVRWLLGYPDQAANWSRLSLEHAEQAKHTNTWGYVLCFGGAMSAVFRRDVAGAKQHGLDLTTFSTQEALPVWLAYGRVLYGWALAHTGELEDGIAQMKMGLVDFEDKASKRAVPNSQHMGFMKSFLLSLLGEGYLRLGRVEESLAQFDEAWSFADASGEGFWKAEISRLKGELLVAGNGKSDARRHGAEDCFLRAQKLASDQGARALELRAVMSLSRLWCHEKPSEACAILRDACESFTEGFDSGDLLEARQLLNQLQGNASAGV